MLRRIILPAAAAALAMIATAPLVADHASARPIGPITGASLVERLQAENQSLREELQLALGQREDIARGLDRIEQINRSSRDVRSARRIAWMIHDLEARTGLDQPWRFDGYDGHDDWDHRHGRPGYPPSTPPGYLSGSSSGPPSYPPVSSTSLPPTFLPGVPGTVIVTDRRTQGPVAMNATDFAALLDLVRGAGFTEQQLSIVRGAAERTYFTVDQVVALLGATRFEEARIEMAVSVGNRVVDPDRWFMIERAFSFSGSAETVRTRLGR